MMLVGIILWWEVIFLSLSASSILLHLSLFFFRLSTYPKLIYMSRFSYNPSECLVTISHRDTPSSRLTRSINSVKLTTSSFSSLQPQMLSLCRIEDTIQVRRIGDSVRHSSKIVSYPQNISRCSKLVFYVLLFTSFHTTLIVFIQHYYWS